MHSLASGAQSGAPHRTLVLAPYVERFARGKRVAVFGDATTGLAGAIASRGARLVHAYDPDGARIAQALALSPPRNLQLAHLASGDLGVRDGAFDVVVVPDLTMFPDVKSLLAQVRQATASGGIVVIATAAQPGAGETGLGYYDFYDAISLQFAEVKMAGQVPFAGWALVDFAPDGEPDVSVDTSLVSPGEPTLYVAVASDRPQSIDGYAIVQLDGEPTGNVSTDELDALRAQLAESMAGRDAARAEAEAGRDARRTAETRIADANRRVTELTQALTEAESVPRRLEAKLAEETRRAGHLATQLARLQEQPSDRPETTRALNEARAESARATSREQDAGRKLDAAERRADSAERRATEVERKVAEAERKVAEAERKVAEAERKVTEAERKITEAERKITEAERKVEGAERKVAEAERKTTEGDARRIADLERRSADAERRADVAVKALADVQRRLDETTKKLAAETSTPRLDPAELTTARARLAELEARVARDAAPTATEQAAEVTELERNLQGRAHEIAELRREVERRGSMVRELLESLEASRAAIAPTARG